MKKFLFLMLMTNLYSAQPSPNNKYVPARYVVLAQEIRHQMAEKYAKKYQMEIFADRGGLAGGVNLLGFDFRIRGPVSKEQLRNILVDCVTDFLDVLNNNEEIRPYLRPYPYTPKGLDITIFVVDKKGKYVSDPWIGSATAFNGKIMYMIMDANDDTKVKTRMFESFDEALEIVKNDPLFEDQK